MYICMHVHMQACASVYVYLYIYIQAKPYLDTCEQHVKHLLKQAFVVLLVCCFALTKP